MVTNSLGISHVIIQRKKEMELFKEGVLACLLLSTGKCNVFLEEFLLHLADQNQPSAARMLDKCVASKEKWA